MTDFVKLLRVASTAIAVLAALSVAPLAQASDGYVKDASGCAVFKANLKPGESVAWRGACASGFAQGRGSATWTATAGASVSFDGNYMQGRLQGAGKMIASGGDRYEGEYKDGMRDGRGVYVAANGDRYEGEYRANQRNGHGVLALASGRRIEGDWKDGTQMPSTSPPPALQAPTQPQQSPPALESRETPAPPQLPDRDARAQAAAQLAPQQRQLAQQQAAERQQQQLAARQAAQEQEAQRQRDYLEQQRTANLERAASLARQRWMNYATIVAILLLPILVAALVYKLKLQGVASEVDALSARVDRAQARASEKSGFFANGVQKPVLWAFSRLYALSASIDDQFLRAGARVAGGLYLVYAIALIAYAAIIAVAWVVGVIIAFVICYLIIRILPTVLAHFGIYVPNLGRFMPVPSFSSGNTTSRQREGLFGDKYTEHTDGSGSVVGTSREREGLFGNKYTEHVDASGNVVGKTEEREELFGDKYAEHASADGQVAGTTREREGFFGDKYSEHSDATGKVVGESRKQQGFFGDEYTESKKRE